MAGRRTTGPRDALPNGFLNWFKVTVDVQDMEETLGT